MTRSEDCSASSDSTEAGLSDEGYVASQPRTAGPLDKASLSKTPIEDFARQATARAALAPSLPPRRSELRAFYELLDARVYRCSLRFVPLEV